MSHQATKKFQSNFLTIKLSFHPSLFFFLNKIRIMVISGEISRMFIEKPKGGQARITSFYGLTLDRILPERSNSPLLKPMEKREWAQRTWLSLTKTPKKHFKKVYCFFLIEMCSLTKWKISHCCSRGSDCYHLVRRSSEQRGESSSAQCCEFLTIKGCKIHGNTYIFRLH